MVIHHKDLFEKISGYLPEKKFLKQLIKNITKDRKKIKLLDDSLKELGNDFAKVIENHYRNAKKTGYAPIIMP